jgi:hypothetical protein
MKLFGRYKLLVSKINNEIAELEKMKEFKKHEQSVLRFTDHVKYCHYSIVIHELDLQITALKRMQS